MQGLDSMFRSHLWYMYLCLYGSHAVFKWMRHLLLMHSLLCLCSLTHHLVSDGLLQQFIYKRFQIHVFMTVFLVQSQSYK